MKEQPFLRWGGVLGNDHARGDRCIGRILSPAMIIPSVLEQWRVFQDLVPHSGTNQSVTDSEDVKKKLQSLQRVLSLRGKCFRELAMSPVISMQVLDRLIAVCLRGSIDTALNYQRHE